MDVKTAYTKTFLMLKEQPLHEESNKTAYFTWWQNVRESYQARSLRLTKIGIEWLESLDIKTYKIKFPAKIIFTPQTFPLVRRICRLPILYRQKANYSNHGKNGITTHDVLW